MKHHADMGAQGHHIHIFIIDVFALDGDFTLDAANIHKVVHAVDRAQKGGFSAARGADQRGDLVARHVKVNAVQRLFFAVKHINIAGGNYRVFAHGWHS